MYMCVGFFRFLRADDLDVYPTRLTLTGIGPATVFQDQRGSDLSFTMAYEQLRYQNP